jgi:hypothetical protein
MASGRAAERWSSGMSPGSASPPSCARHASDGRPDPRISVRESESQLGNLASDFDFTQPARAPMVLPVG